MAILLALVVVGYLVGDNWGENLSPILWLLGAAGFTAGLWTYKMSARHSECSAAAGGASGGIGLLAQATFTTVFGLCAFIPLSILILLPAGLAIRSR